MTTKKAKSLDCVAMKRDIQSQITAETQGMSRAEELAYYQQRAMAGPLATLWRVAATARDAVAAGTDPRKAPPSSPKPRGSVRRRR